MSPELFLYGTLRHGPLLQALAGPGDGQARSMPATLRDHAVERLAGAEVPLLVARPGAVAEGVVWRGLTPAQRHRLDVYERAFGYEVRPLLVTRADGSRGMAMAYLGGPALESSGEPWSLAEWQRTTAPASLAVAEELARHDPPLEGTTLLRQWHMIRGRAFARLRAAEAVPVAQLRHAARPEDFSITAARPLQGAFFKLAQLEVDHLTIGGAMSGPLPREVLVGADAALVLPYDPLRDRVLLVEQFRPAPARRGRPQSLDAGARGGHGGRGRDARRRRPARDGRGGRRHLAGPAPDVPHLCQPRFNHRFLLLLPGSVCPA